MIEIDASVGEGGGQIVRTALTLAMCTGRAVALRNIRARRSNPGLRAQHLAAVRAAACICNAHVEGDRIGSSVLSFRPGRIRPGNHEIDVGTAGSTMLVFQTIFPALACCDSPSRILLRGGTHNPRAPTFEFVRDAFLPVIARLGFRAQMTLERPGFYAKGGGIVHVTIEPRSAATELALVERGPLRAVTAQALLSGLPDHIAERELNVLRTELDLPPGACVTEYVQAFGPGNALHVKIETVHLTSVFIGFGMRGVPAEKVAGDLAEEVRRYLDADVAVDQYLADQLLVPLALSAGGSFTTLPLSSHTRTNLSIIQRFIPVTAEADQLAPARWRLKLHVPPRR